MKGRKRNEHRGRRWLGLVALILLSTSAYLLGWSNVFSVKQIVVVGAPSPSEMLLIKNGIHVGEKLARLEPKNLNATLNNFPWLDRSTISRNWLTGVVTIHVWARTPIALSDSKLIDNKGKLFDLPGNPGSNLPAIIAPTLDARIFAVNLIVDLPTQLRDSLLTLTTTGVHSAQLLIQERSFTPPRQVTIIWGDLSNNELKARVYYSLIALPENQNISLVDVSAPHAPIVK